MISGTASLSLLQRMRSHVRVTVGCSHKRPKAVNTRLITANDTTAEKKRIVFYITLRRTCEHFVGDAPRLHDEQFLLPLNLQGTK